MSTLRIIVIAAVIGLVTDGVATGQELASSLKTYTETFSYDDDGRLAGVVYNDADALTYGYDAAGNLASYKATRVTLTDVEGSAVLPDEFALRSNYPNPFNPSTTIRYDLPEPSQVRLELFDTQGRLVLVLLDKYQSAGFHRVTWTAERNGRQQIGSGLYVVRMTAGDFVATRRILLVK